MRVDWDRAMTLRSTNGAGVGLMAVIRVGRRVWEAAQTPGRDRELVKDALRRRRDEYAAEFSLAGPWADEWFDGDGGMPASPGQGCAAPARLPW